MIVWATSFPNALSLTSKEKALNPGATTIYKKPATLRSLITNYKKIALESTTIQHFDTNNVSHKSRSCNNCALCGNFGQHINMVKTTSTVHNNKGKIFNLKQHLNCSNYGVYAAQCRCCSKYYVGQTKNKFSIRWSGHRSAWNSNIINLYNDNNALYSHFYLMHTSFLQTHPKISQCLDVIFLEQPNANQLDFCESKWISRLNANINISKTILPLIK